MTDSVALSDLARQAWRALMFLKAADERQIARGLGCKEAEAREALAELQRAGVASRRRRKPIPGRPPALLWALNEVRVKR